MPDATLKEDITSGRRELYGAKESVVKVISIRGNVAIVEDKKGERFPVRKELIEEIN